MIWGKPKSTHLRWVETGLSCFSICIQCYIIMIYKFVYTQKGYSYAIKLADDYNLLFHYKYLVKNPLCPRGHGDSVPNS